jgi:hypothetical protein
MEEKKIRNMNKTNREDEPEKENKRKRVSGKRSVVEVAPITALAVARETMEKMLKACGLVRSKPNPQGVVHVVLCSTVNSVGAAPRIMSERFNLDGSVNSFGAKSH